MVRPVSSPAVAPPDGAMPSRFEPMKGSLLLVKGELAFKADNNKLYKVSATSDFDYQATRLQNWQGKEPPVLLTRPATIEAFVEADLVPKGFDGVVRVNAAYVNSATDPNRY